MSNKTFPSNMFNWYREDQQLTQEASTLGFKATDPIPNSIDIRSMRTGAVRTFTKTGVETANEEGEIVAWHFQCKQDKTMTLIIWND